MLQNNVTMLPQLFGSEAPYRPKHLVSSPQWLKKTLILWLVTSTVRAGAANYEQLNNMTAHLRKRSTTQDSPYHQASLRCGALAAFLNERTDEGGFVEPPNSHEEWLIRKHDAFSSFTTKIHGFSHRDQTQWTLGMHFGDELSKLSRLTAFSTADPLVARTKNLTT